MCLIWWRTKKLFQNLEKLDGPVLILGLRQNARNANAKQAHLGGIDEIKSDRLEEGMDGFWQVVQQEKLY